MIRNIIKCYRRARHLEYHFKILDNSIKCACLCVKRKIIGLKAISQNNSQGNSKRKINAHCMATKCSRRLLITFLSTN